MTSLVRLPALAVLGFAFALPSLSVAQEEQRAQPPAERQQEARRPRAEAESRLPPESVTRHTIELPGRTIKLTAMAGSLALTNPEGRAAGRIRVRGLYPRRRGSGEPARDLRGQRRPGRILGLSQPSGDRTLAAAARRAEHQPVDCRPS